MMVAAVEHGTGLVLAQVEVESKSNEIPAVRELSSGLDLTGRIVTVDAMHAPHDTARCLLGRRADYVLSAIKDNQQTIFEDLAAIAIVRCNARFRNLPEANRHYAARAQEALDTILNTPTA